jgi:hypothetical protein
MSVIASIEAEYRRYKVLAEAAIGQLGDAELFEPGPGGSNSIDVLVRHVAGNLQSRFSDFRTSDGEKPWRDRDEEFEPAALTRVELMSAWDTAWQVLLAEVTRLTDAELSETVTIRRQPLSIDEALHRSLAHTAYHVGQIVYLAKAIRSDAWKCLSIPRGASKAYNAAAPKENAAAHAAHLSRLSDSRS